MATASKRLTHISQRGYALTSREKKPKRFLKVLLKKETDFLLSAVTQTYLPQSEAPPTSEVSMFSFQCGKVFFLLMNKTKLTFVFLNAETQTKVSHPL